MSFPDHDTMFRSAILEGVRGWLFFDRPMQQQISASSGKMSIDQVRTIALEYNFRRNLPASDRGVQIVADQANSFAGKKFSTLSERADEIEKAVLAIEQLLTEKSLHLSKSGKARKFRIVSGMTKLTWFVAPENWTPFDRLAAKAVGAKNVDTLARMKKFYEILDRPGFSQAAATIAECARDTPFKGISGERILDKYLMGYGEKDWTRNWLQSNAAFRQALPERWRADVEKFEDAVMNSDAAKFRRKAPE